VGGASCTVSRVVLLLVLLRATNTAALGLGIALGIMLVEAPGVLNSFRLRFHDCSRDSCP
jgi:hypothetical protein